MKIFLQMFLKAMEVKELVTQEGYKFKLDLSFQILHFFA